MNKKPPPPSAAMVLMDSDHSGRDEMNLAGHSFALLQNGTKGTAQTYIKYEWERVLPSGKVVTASWEVSSPAELGALGPADEKLYLVLLELTREAAGEDGDWPQTVHFSRYDLLERMGMGKGAKDYRALRNSFARLQGVSIRAEHAFFDARTKSPLTSIGFGVLEEYALADEPKGRKGRENASLPLSSFRWTSRMHESFLAGNVRNLALDFVLSLEHPTSWRLFRFLDMMRKSKKPPLRTVSIGVFKLRDRLGMTAYPYVSKVKEKLASAHDELIGRGYLQKVDFRKGANGEELAVYTFAQPNALPETKGVVNQAKEQKEVIKQVVPIDTSVPADSSDVARILSQAAYAVFNSLEHVEKERLRDIARQGVEPAFWDRLERPDSPMGLKLWELVAKEYPQAYQKQLEQGREVR